MSLLDSAEAVVLLEDAKVPVEIVNALRPDLAKFLLRYLPLFYRDEQRELAAVVVEGKLSDLQRKTSEPIAYQAGRERKPVQHFVGAGKWDDEAVLAEFQRHVGEELADADGVLVCDGSAFPKKGSESCGVDRQWCGRLGKVDNCQVGVFLAYVGRRGRAPLDRRLYLPKDWANDAGRRQKCHVPEEVVFQEKWRIALEQIKRCRHLAHGWVAGDDEFGRVTEFRRELKRRRELYVLDVPANTLIRELELVDGRKPPFEQVSQWAARQPSSRWRKERVRNGEKGEMVVWALTAVVQTKDENGRVGGAERVLVIRPVDQQGDASFALSNALSGITLEKLVHVKGQRHGVEQVFQEGKGEVGLDHYEVRSWVGWHHHMTLSMLALWYLSLERRVWGEKGAGPDRATNTFRNESAPGTQPHSGRNRRNHQQSGAA